MADDELPQTPEPCQGFKVGDTVHVYNGTSKGIRAHQTVTYIGTVVGFHEEVACSKQHFGQKRATQAGRRSIHVQVYVP
jgi:hypothetical protein